MGVFRTYEATFFYLWTAVRFGAADKLACFFSSFVAPSYIIHMKITSRNMLDARGALPINIRSYVISLNMDDE